jgi:hypothetical protein
MTNSFGLMMHRWFWVGSIYLFIHGLAIRNAVEAICGLGMITSVFVCDVLEYRDRVFSHSTYNQTRTDATRDYKEALTNVESIAHAVQSMIQPNHAQQIIPVHLCTCVYCTILRYDRDHVPYLITCADAKPVRVIREETRYDGEVEYDDDFV